jgi:hypothetical protein
MSEQETSWFVADQGIVLVVGGYAGEHVRPASPLEVKLHDEIRQLRKKLARNYAKELELALDLAEADELYAEELRPYFLRIFDALKRNSSSKQAT